MAKNINTATSVAPAVLPGIDLYQLKLVKCNNCNGTSFERCSALRLASRFQSTSGQPTLVEVPLGFKCVICGNINDFDAPELRKPAPTDDTEPPDSRTFHS